jgi:hypothetical protein
MMLMSNFKAEAKKLQRRELAAVERVFPLGLLRSWK